MVHLAASWGVLAENSFTSRRDTDVVTHHRQIGIDGKEEKDSVDHHIDLTFFCLSLHLSLSISYPPQHHTVIVN